MFMDVLVAVSLSIIVVWLVRENQRREEEMVILIREIQWLSYDKDLDQYWVSEEFDQLSDKYGLLILPRWKVKYENRSEDDEV